MDCLVGFPLLQKRLERLALERLRGAPARQRKRKKQLTQNARSS